jgi:hypothetical protein
MPVVKIHAGKMIVCILQRTLRNAFQNSRFAVPDSTLFPSFMVRGSMKAGGAVSKPYPLASRGLNAICI